MGHVGRFNVQKNHARLLAVFSEYAKVNENADEKTYGMLYYADVYSFGEIHSEIEKIIIVDKLVDNWTYPLIQPCLLQEATNRGFL